MEKNKILTIPNTELLVKTEQNTSGMPQNDKEKSLHTYSDMA